MMRFFKNIFIGSASPGDALNRMHPSSKAQPVGGAGVHAGAILDDICRKHNCKYRILPNNSGIQFYFVGPEGVEIPFAYVNESGVEQSVEKAKKELLK